MESRGGQDDDGLGVETSLAPRPPEDLARRESPQLWKVAEHLLRDLHRALAPRVFITLSRSLWWLTFGRIRAQCFAQAFYVGIVGTMIAIYATTILGMAISPPMSVVLILLGGYLTGTLYTGYAELKGWYSTPELEATRAAQRESEAQYQVLEDHKDQLERSGAAPEEIKAALVPRQQAILAANLRKVTRITGDTSKVQERIDAARARRDEVNDAISQYAAAMKVSGATQAQIDAEITARRQTALDAFIKEIDAASLPTLFKVLPAARLRRDAVLEALDVQAAHMKRHGATQEAIELAIGGSRMAATETYVRAIDAAMSPRAPRRGPGDPPRRSLGSGSDADPGR